MAVIKRINNIPVCDIELRNKIAALKDLLDNKANVNHEHEEYITKDELIDYATKTYVDTRFNEIDDLINNIDLSIYATKQDVESKGYLTSIPSEYITKSKLDAMGFITKDSDTNSLATITYVDNKIAELKRYIDNTFALKSDADFLKAWAERLRLEINNLYAGYEELKQRVDDLKDSGDDIPCTGISLNKGSITMEIGDEESLTVTRTPSNCTDSIRWSSNDTSIATCDGVDEEGTIYAHKSGTTTVTASCGNYSASCNVTVNEQFIAVPCTSLTCNKNMTLNIGHDANLNVNIQPSNTTDSLYWDVSDSSAISVYKSSGGYWVHASKSGTYTVTLYCGSCTSTCRVTVNEEFEEIRCQYITVSPSSATLSVGESISITGSAYPSDTTDYMLVYSSDVSIISIGNGSAGTESTKTIRPTANGVGTASIIFNCNGVIGSCSVTVK